MINHSRDTKRDFSDLFWAVQLSKQTNFPTYISYWVNSLANLASMKIKPFTWEKGNWFHVREFEMKYPSLAARSEKAVSAMKHQLHKVYKNLTLPSFLLSSFLPSSLFLSHFLSHFPSHFPSLPNFQFCSTSSQILPACFPPVSPNEVFLSMILHRTFRFLPLPPLPAPFSYHKPNPWCCQAHGCGLHKSPRINKWE